MSRVFLAEERALRRRVVVKVLSPELAACVNFERFKHEIVLTAQLQHPHILPVFTTGETEGLPYYTMPYVEGESLGRSVPGGRLSRWPGITSTRRSNAATTRSYRAIG
jgi:serine/threonine-protein kinase